MVVAEFDYPLASFTSQISSSISEYAATLKNQQDENLPQEKLAYTAAPMTFREPLMKARYEIFLNGIRQHMQKSK